MKTGGIPCDEMGMPLVLLFLYESRAQSYICFPITNSNMMMVLKAGWIGMDHTMLHEREAILNFIVNCLGDMMTLHKAQAHIQCYFQVYIDLTSILPCLKHINGLDLRML